jgi:hypothetical protein
LKNLLRNNNFNKKTKVKIMLVKKNIILALASAAVVNASAPTQGVMHQQFEPELYALTSPTSNISYNPSYNPLLSGTPYPGKDIPTPATPTTPTTPTSWPDLLTTFRTNPYYTDYSHGSARILGTQTHLPIVLNTLQSIEGSASTPSDALAQQMQVILQITPGNQNITESERCWCIWTSEQTSQQIMDFRIYPLLYRFLVSRSQQQQRVEQPQSWWKSCWPF